MPIDPSAVKWDAPDPAAIKWDEPKAEPGYFDRVLGNIKATASEAGNVAAGAVRGAGSIGATLIRPFESGEENKARRTSMDDALRTMGADPDSFGYGAGKLGAEVAGTLGVGGAVAAPLRLIPGAAPMANALASAGMTTGAKAAPGVAGFVQNGLMRAGGGAAVGGSAAGLIDPEQAKTGAAVGGLLPPTLAAVGKGAYLAGRVIAGPDVPAAVRGAVQSARQAGYVIPPTQARPTLANRALEGFSGKITTAQNASAKNQPITDELAKKAIGAADLSPAGIKAVRDGADQAYTNLAQSVPHFVADSAFEAAVRGAGGSKALPGIANKEIDTLIDALAGQKQLNPQQTIESIKRLRFEGGGNKGAQDPTKRALGAAQMKIAGALEDLIDRNLTGAPEVLANYRTARQTLAKVYDVEEALNPASGHVDAKKIAQLQEKGRPLTGELKTIANFAGQFPKAVQTVEKMGSLPQVSPLDFGALGTISALTSNPLLMAGVMARPAARAAVLSPAVQNRLIASPRGLPRDPRAAQLLYRTAPLLPGDR